MTKNQRSAIKGPAVFLAQFMGSEAPFDSLANLARWAGDLGYKGIQVPCSPKLFDLDKAAASKDYCDELRGICAEAGVEISELSTHQQGQLVAVHPAYAGQFDSFAPDNLCGKVKEQSEWAVDQLKKAAKVAKNLGHTAQVGFSGALAWPYLYPYPRPPAGLVGEAFKELARRWTPILNAFDEAGVNYAYEIHPSEDLMDGTSFERFLTATNNHPRVAINYDPSHFVLQQLDYLQFIDIYADYIKAFHVKDAEFNPNGRQGVYGGFSGWVGRAGRFRSLGDGQVDFSSIFSRLCQYGYSGWAVLEWECCLKSPEQGAREGVPFIASHIIEPTARVFDDLVADITSQAIIRKKFGIE